jgi:hypothetical protein
MTPSHQRARPPDSALRLAGGEISSDRNEIVFIQIGDNLNHERAPRSGAISVFDIVELPNDVARRATRDTRYGSETFQIGSMAQPTWNCLVPSPFTTRVSPFATLPTGAYAVNVARESYNPNSSRLSGTSTMRFPIDSLAPSSAAA